MNHQRPRELQPQGQPQPQPSAVRIPRTPLGTNILEAAQIKHDMTKLLRELEQTATGRPITKPGTWRHHPTRPT